MRFITITLIVHAPAPVTGEQESTQERFREVLGNARLAEEHFAERSSALIGSPAQVIEKVRCGARSCRRPARRHWLRRKPT